MLEKEGICYLCIKTVERAHTPKKMWEKIQLSKNFTEALKQVDEHLMYWADHKVLIFSSTRSSSCKRQLFWMVRIGTPVLDDVEQQWFKFVQLNRTIVRGHRLAYQQSFQKNRCKQRLTKLRQKILRERRLIVKDQHSNLIGIKKKTERREAVREEKAEKAAKVELAIESELLDRLKQGVYGDLYMNLDRGAFDKMLDGEMEEGEQEMEVEEEIEELMAGEDADEALLAEDEREVNYVEGLGDFSSDDEGDDLPSDFAWSDEEGGVGGEGGVEGGDPDQSGATGAGGASSSSAGVPGGPRAAGRSGKSGSSERKSMDIEDLAPRKKKKKPAKREIEYEIEEEFGAPVAQLATR